MPRGESDWWCGCIPIYRHTERMVRTQRKMKQRRQKVEGSWRAKNGSRPARIKTYEVSSRPYPNHPPKGPNNLLDNPAASAISSLRLVRAVQIERHVLVVDVKLFYLWLDQDFGIFPIPCLPPARFSRLLDTVVNTYFGAVWEEAFCAVEEAEEGVLDLQYENNGGTERYNGTRENYKMEHITHLLQACLPDLPYLMYVSPLLLWIHQSPIGNGNSNTKTRLRHERRPCCGDCEVSLPECPYLISPNYPKTASVRLRSYIIMTCRSPCQYSSEVARRAFDVVAFMVTYAHHMEMVIFLNCVLLSKMFPIKDVPYQVTPFTFHKI